MLILKIVVFGLIGDVTVIYIFSTKIKSFLTLQFLNLFDGTRTCDTVYLSLPQGLLELQLEITNSHYF